MQDKFTQAGNVCGMLQRCASAVICNYLTFLAAAVPTLAFLVPRTFFILFFLSFLCLRDTFFFSKSPFCNFRITVVLETKVNTKFLESDPYSGQAMFGFKLFKVVHRVIYKSKSGWFATTEICPESKAGDYIWSDFVHLGQLLRNLLLRNWSTTRVQNINNLKQKNISLY